MQGSRVKVSLLSQKQVAPWNQTAVIIPKVLVSMQCFFFLQCHTQLRLYYFLSPKPAVYKNAIFTCFLSFVFNICFHWKWQAIWWKVATNQKWTLICHKRQSSDFRQTSRILSTVRPDKYTIFCGVAYAYNRQCKLALHLISFLRHPGAILLKYLLLVPMHWHKSLGLCNKKKKKKSDMQ